MKRILLLLLISVSLHYSCKRVSDEQYVPDPENYRVYFEGGSIQISKIFDSTYALTQHSFLMRSVSYLIIGTEKSLLFDTGVDFGKIPGIIDSLVNNELIVINSHTHFDQISNNYAFNNIYALNNQVTINHTQGIANSEIEEFCKLAYLRTDFEIPEKIVQPWNIQQYVSDGDIISLGNRDLEIVETPGHSADGLTLLDHRTETMYIGDVFFHDQGFPILCHLPTSNFDDYRATVNKLYSMSTEYSYICPTHGDIKMGAYELEKVKLLFDAIADGTSTVTENNGFYIHRKGTVSIVLNEMAK